MRNSVTILKIMDSVFQVLNDGCYPKKIDPIGNSGISLPDDKRGPNDHSRDGRFKLF